MGRPFFGPISQLFDVGKYPQKHPKALGLMGKGLKNGVFGVKNGVWGGQKWGFWLKRAKISIRGQSEGLRRS